MTKAGWYPVADGLFEAYWTGSTWIDGSRRLATPPGPVATGAPRVAASTASAIHRRSVVWWFVVAGGVMGAVSAFLPWMSAVGTFNRNAFQMGDNMGFSFTGVLVLVVGLMVAATAAATALGAGLPWLFRWGPVGGGISLLGTALLSISGIHHWASGVEAEGGYASIGYGLWVAAVAGGFCILAGFGQSSARDTTPTSEPTSVMPGVAMDPKTPPPISVSEQGHDDDLLVQQLLDLHAAGLLSDDEFAAKKAHVLGLASPVSAVNDVLLVGRLLDLHASGVITDAEFEEKKWKVLRG